MPDGAIDREFADEELVFDGPGPGLLRGDHHADGDGQVIGWPRLADVGRGQIDGDAFPDGSEGKR